MKMFWKYI